jgi:hypothetical protein
MGADGERSVKTTTTDSHGVPLKNAAKNDAAQRKANAPASKPNAAVPPLPTYAEATAPLLRATAPASKPNAAVPPPPTYAEATTPPPTYAEAIKSPPEHAQQARSDAEHLAHNNDETSSVWDVGQQLRVYGDAGLDALGMREKLTMNPNVANALAIVMAKAKLRMGKGGHAPAPETALKALDHATVAVAHDNNAKGNNARD